MSGQEATRAMPKKCQELVDKDVNPRYKEWYTNYTKYEQSEIAECLGELQSRANAIATKTIKENDLQVAGLSGTGGLVCGLGLFPCICKLIAKLRG